MSRTATDICHGLQPRRGIARHVAAYFGAVIAVAVTVGVLFVVAARPAMAQDIPSTEKIETDETTEHPVQRRILALYDAQQEGPINVTRIHKLAEMPLNHLGYALDFHDVNTSLPEISDLKPYRAILTWFVEPLNAPTAYVRWLDGATGSGLRYVMLGEIAPREPDELMPTINRILARIGLQHQTSFIDITYKSKVITADPAMMGFEQKIDKALPGFPVLSLSRPDARAHLAIDTKYGDTVVRSVPVATGPGGGFAAQNYTVALEPNTDRLSWVLNPFQFFKLALGEKRFPIPDVTTVSGRRIYFSHIDGDGWNNVSEIEGYRESQTLSSEVIAKEAIGAYPDLPVSVGLVAGDVQPLLGGIPAAVPIARKLYAMPHVEVASHTHTHPYNWGFFEKYDRAAEEKLIAGYNPPDQPFREKMTEQLLRIAGKAYRSPRYDKYISGSDLLPRTYLRTNFNLDLEVAGALRISENFAPPGKKAKLYLWSGDTTPFEGAIAATRRAGVRNINGGDSRLDDEFPSVAYVPPIGRAVGKERQIYSVNSNENTYTNDWTGPYGGQIFLEKTLDNTNLPRRLKGFNLYYHMYSGEKPASLRAILHILERARNTDVTPITASHYAAMADDWYGVEMVETGLFTWVIKNRGAVETVRFDDAESLELDPGASRGVIGANNHAGALYVSLDAAAKEAVVTLRARGLPILPALGADPAPLATLVHSRWRFSNLVTTDCGQTVRAEGFGPADMVWRARPGRGLRITVSRDGVVLNSEIRWADANGLIPLRYPINGQTPIEVGFKCHD